MSEENLLSKRDYLNKLEQGWQTLQSYIESLSEAQMTVPVDAAGWTVKDHLMHLVVWEEGMWAILNKKILSEAMGLSEDELNSGDYDKMNAIIQQAHQEKSLAEVRAALEDTHTRFLATVETLTDDDLHRHYQYYQPHVAPRGNAPVIGWLISDTYEHYTEHIPWMQAIVESH